MAPQQDLVKIGLEGFELIDRFYGAPIRRPANNNVGKQRQGRWGVQATHQSHKEEPVVINSKEAASKFGGIMVVNYYPKTKPQNRWGKFIQAFKP
ncbi:hypothetical protein JHK82_023977 [Glycine max]|uniref:Uncharacterized protein n=1 Tax=Glycine soja TaxID=3848 RepID=A0A445IWL2_GLYSO|nr:hypothetical protein JHK87_023931 [Glycine soja]KAG5132789.1 hypothetical protein JHK82_023977 [Glycine max]KHN26524.1 hypothetical protein glysoja_019763 [Glycine soja]RZB90541.1 hypothetical protein D0Y65_023142 [Glycine soja]